MSEQAAENEQPDGDPMADVASKFGWDDELVTFLRDAHQRFKALSDRVIPPTEATP